MKINWQNNISDYQNESIQDVVDRMNINTISSYGFTIKMSEDNFNIVRTEITNAKFMKCLPVLNNVVDVLVLHINEES